jgi:hypothetical protein
MKSLLRIILTVLILTTLLVACNMPAATEDPTNAINTAVAGTQQSQALGQATVNATVLTAMPATPTPGLTIDYVALTEDELAALIDEAVTEAVAATEATTTAVTTTTYDDAVTTEEVTYVYDYYYYADYYVDYAEELMAQYYALYGDMAYEMIAEMSAIQTELNQMNDTLSSIDSSLQEISTTLSQGLALATETIDQLESAAQQAQTNAQELKNQAQDMLTVLQADQQGRMDQLSQIQPNNIPTDKLAALQTGFTFIDTAKQAMGDNKLSRDELMGLAQIGANAQAGFQQFGGAGGIGANSGIDLTQFTAKFSEITTQFARGQMPQGRANLEGFERSLGTRPSGGGLPGNGGGLPGGGLPGGGLPGGGGGPRP